MSKSKKGLWLAAVLLLAVAGTTFTWRTIGQKDLHMREELVEKATLLVQAVDVKALEALTGTEADLARPEYVRLKEQLRQVRYIVPQCRFVYLLGQKKDGTVFFYADSEPAGAKDESPAGQTYDEAPASCRRVLAGGQGETEGPYTDRWGMWISAFAPIGDRQGQGGGAAVGIDINARDWKWTATQAGTAPLLFTAPECWFS